MLEQDIRDGNGLRSHLTQVPPFVNGQMGPDSLDDLPMAIPSIRGRARTVHNSGIFTSKLFYFFYALEQQSVVSPPVALP